MAEKMNRAQRRRWQANFRKAKIESLPRPQNDTKPEEPPCDFPGCGFRWDFVTMATIDGTRKPVARRCAAHRLA